MPYGYDLKKEEEVKEYIKNLGTEYRYGCFSEKKPEVCHLLGDYLESIDKDFEKAAKIYKTNCDDSNFPKSCFKTANYFFSGKGGVKQSHEKTLEYFDKACTLGDTESCFRSGVLSILNSRSEDPLRTFAQGVENLKKSCDADHPEGCHHLSSLYMDGDKNGSILKDMTKAFEFAVKACELKNMYACANVSLMYKKGDGVPKDMEQSDKYKRKAIEIKKEYDSKMSLNFQDGLNPV